MSESRLPGLQLPDGTAGRWVSPAQTEHLGRDKGAYFLVIRLDTPPQLDIRRLGAQALPAGTYVYAGSAYGPGGMAARLKRHFRKDKSPHWHIDRLTLAASDMSAFAVVDGHECRLVASLLAAEGYETALPGFGSTDCRTCQSHLLRVTTSKGA